MPKKKRRLFTNSPRLSIPEKANRILNFILFVMIFILIRAWHLAVVQYDAHFEEAQRPQQRSVIERALRGSIRDRFGIPLATNKVQYNAAIVYSHIRNIPSVRWKTNKQGERVKKYLRREHIENLSKLLANTLSMTATHVEDLIHSHAALFPNVPFVIKADISEQQFFRLKMLEKNWRGLYAERVPKRFYPQEKVASHIIGYMGAISRDHYLDIAREKTELKLFLNEWESGAPAALPEGLNSVKEVKERSEELQQRAYSINDQVGKSGIEGRFDEELRGYYGKRIYDSDAQGNFLKELPGATAPLSGKGHILTISKELQEFAEQLLTENEEVRDGRSTTFDWKAREHLSLKQPWIKGGAIVVMDPNNGDILALASYPRYNPNDFIPSGDLKKRRKQNQSLRKWFESESHITQIWDGKLPLNRERFSKTGGGFYEEKMNLSWNNYLKLILPEKHPVTTLLKAKGSIGWAIRLQNSVEKWLEVEEVQNINRLINALYSTKEHVSYRDKMTEQEQLAFSKKVTIADRKEFDSFFASLPNNYDKILLVDLCRLAVNPKNFSAELLKLTSSISIEQYRKEQFAMAQINEEIKDMSKELFNELNFLPWRKEHQKQFLREKRKEEKAAKRYHRPYLDHIEAEEKKMFNAFFKENSSDFILTFLQGNPLHEVDKNHELSSYLEYFGAWEEELEHGAHAKKSWYPSYHLLKKALGNWPSRLSKEYLKSMRQYKELTRPLYGRYRHLRTEEGKQLEKHLAAAFYPLYGFGFARSTAFRQATPQGSIFKLVVAYEALLQQYNALSKAGEVIHRLNPFEMIDQVKKTGSRHSSWSVGSHLNGEIIPEYYKGGRLPKTDRRNSGHIDIIKALEVSSNSYFALVASEVLSDPEDINGAATQFSFGARTGIDLPGEISGTLPKDLRYNKTGLYFYAIGQHSLVVTPLQTAVMLSSLVNGGRVLQPKILKEKRGWGSKRVRSVERLPTKLKQQLFLPQMIREILVEGMYRVVNGENGCARKGRIYNYYEYPHVIKDYNSLCNQLIGKSGTAEIVQSVDLDLKRGTFRYKHIWFAGVSFDPKENSSKKPHENPELAIVIYLKFGNFGKEAAPLATQILKKWREIQSKSPFIQNNQDQ